MNEVQQELVRIRRLRSGNGTPEELAAHGAEGRDRAAELLARVMDRLDTNEASA